MLNHDIGAPGTGAVKAIYTLRIRYFYISILICIISRNVRPIGLGNNGVGGETVDISIRAMADGDVPQVISACADWQELAAFGPPYWRPRSPAELRRKIAATAGPQPSTEYSFVVTAGGSPVGECSLHAIDWRNRLAQVGVCIWDPAERAKGYGRAAIQHVIDWGTGYLGLRRLEAWIVDGNIPSIELFKSLGFVYEGTLRGRYLEAGTARDVQVLALSEGN